MNSKDLAALADKIRYQSLEAIAAGGSGHPGGSLSIADIITVLYFHEMNINPQDPHDPNRDRFVLSKGHACPALYAALADKGYFDVNELKKLRHVDSFLQGHPDMKHTPGVDMSTGSLGQGISAACGIAKAGKMQGRDFRVYTLLGDGEIDEGQVWEALMFAAHYKLDNLTVILDYNGLQIDGTNDEVMSCKEPQRRFEDFGFNVINIDGNDIDSIINAFALARKCKGKPTAIVAKTVKGKGVSFMENQVGWHGKAPSAQELAQAAKELGV